MKQPPDKAFELFTEGFGSWWPLATHAVDAQSVSCAMECRPGGQIFEVGASGERTPWGRIEVWEPPSHLQLYWQRSEGLEPQRVAVRFASHNGGAKVVLECSVSPELTARCSDGESSELGSTEGGEPKAMDHKCRVELLIAEARELNERGEHRQAVARLREARALSKEQQEPSLERMVDRSRCVVAMDRGRSRSVLGTLKAQLSEPLEPIESMRANYMLARAYEHLKESRKGRFYSQTALALARDHAGEDWLAACLNQHANMLVAGGVSLEATELYREALDLNGVEEDPATAQLLCNLGYCMLLDDEPREALDSLHSSLKLWRAIGNRKQEILPRLDLAQAYLALRRYGKAIRFARSASELANRFSDHALTSRALFLLAECGAGMNDLDLMVSCREQLRVVLPPESRHLLDANIPLGFNEAINWRA